MIPRRYRILLWATPVFALQWFAIIAINPDGGGGQEYVSVGFVFGTFFGHVTLAAAWVTLGAGPIRWRVPLSLAWVGMLPIAVAINLAINGGPSEGAVFFGALLFGQWLIVQLPLWGLAIGIGLRLRHVDDWEKANDRRARQFSLRHLMLITAIVGVLLTAGRLLISWLSDSFNISREGPVFIFLVVASAVTALPLLLAGLLPRRAVPAVLLIMVLIGIATAWEVTLLQMLPGFTGAGPQTGHFVSINVFTAATILAGVLLPRLNGYGTMAPQQAT